MRPILPLSASESTPRFGKLKFYPQFLVDNELPSEKAALQEHLYRIPQNADDHDRLTVRQRSYFSELDRAGVHVHFNSETGDGEPSMDIEQQQLLGSDGGNGFTPVQGALTKPFGGRLQNWFNAAITEGMSLILEQQPASHPWDDLMPNELHQQLFKQGIVTFHQNGSKKTEEELIAGIRQDQAERLASLKASGISFDYWASSNRLENADELEVTDGKGFRRTLFRKDHDIEHFFDYVILAGLHHQIDTKPDIQPLKPEKPSDYYDMVDILA